MSVRTPSSARVLAANPCAIPGGELDAAQLAPTLRQGANTNQNTTVAGGGKLEESSLGKRPWLALACLCLC